MLPVPDLIALLEKRLGVEGDTALARALGYGPGGERKVKRWRDETSTPRYADAWLLLETAGMLAATGTGQAPPQAMRDRLESLEARVNAIHDLNVKGFDAIRDALGELPGLMAEAIRAAASPPPPAARRGSRKSA